MVSQAHNRCSMSVTNVHRHSCSSCSFYYLIHLFILWDSHAQIHISLIFTSSPPPPIPISPRIHIHYIHIYISHSWLHVFFLITSRVQLCSPHTHQPNKVLPKPVSLKKTNSFFPRSCSPIHAGRHSHSKRWCLFCKYFLIYHIFYKLTTRLLQEEMYVDVEKTSFTNVSKSRVTI